MYIINYIYIWAICTCVCSKLYICIYAVCVFVIQFSFPPLWYSFVVLSCGNYMNLTGLTFWWLDFSNKVHNLWFHLNCTAFHLWTMVSFTIYCLTLDACLKVLLLPEILPSSVIPSLTGGFRMVAYMRNQTLFGRHWTK